MIGDHEPNRHHSGGGGLTFSEEDREQKKLGKSFVQAAKECNAFKLQKLLDRNAPVNATDFPDRATALHYVAAYRARPALRVLLKKRQM